LVWLLAVTLTAGAQKIFHPDPRIGFLAQARVLAGKIQEAERLLVGAGSGQEAAAGLTAAEAPAARDRVEAARTDLAKNRQLRFNQLLDAVVAGAFMTLVLVIVAASVREWILLLAGRRLAQLRESPPVWLPAYALVEGKPAGLLGLLALGFALVKELSGEAELDRAQRPVPAGACSGAHTGHAVARCGGAADAVPAEGPGDVRVDGLDRSSQARLFVAVTERRYRDVRRCC
jgi:carbon starvation protein